MRYVQQSLSPNEEIVRIGQFHWWYDFRAYSWVFYGLVIMCGVLYGGYYWDVSQFMRTEFSGLPQHLQSAAWADTVKQKGGFFTIIANLHWTLKIIAFMGLAFGLSVFAKMMVIKHTTEICLTSDRLVLKRGIIARYVAEISVDRIEGVDVFQGIFARLLGFGYVSVRGMGVGEVRLPQIANPIDFRKSIERSRAMNKGEL